MNYKTLTLANNKGFVWVDKQDYQYLSKYNWWLTSNGYAATKVNGKTTRMQRLITNALKEQLVDHINHNKLDNRKNNLRLCDKQESQRYRKIQKNNSTGYKGVYKKQDKFIAQIYIDRKRISLGSFKNIKDAAKAYNKAALKYFNEFAYLNEGV